METVTANQTAPAPAGARRPADKPPAGLLANAYRATCSRYPHCPEGARCPCWDYTPIVLPDASLLSRRGEEILAALFEIVDREGCKPDAAPHFSSPELFLHYTASSLTCPCASSGASCITCAAAVENCLCAPGAAFAVLRGAVGSARAKNFLISVWGRNLQEAGLWGNE